MIYVFNDYELNTHVFELRHAGRPFPLAPQVFNVLLYLVRHRDRVVGKRELIASLWVGQHVTEGALSYCIREARKALNDNGHDQQCIKTINRRGYRFIATVEEYPAQEGRVGLPGDAPPQEVPDLAPDAPGLPSAHPVMHPPSLKAPPVDKAPAVDVPDMLPSDGPATPLPTSLGLEIEPAVRRPFVGRELTLTSLHACLDQSRRGQGQVVEIVADHGLGKSRLLEEFRRSLADQPLTYLYSCCYAQAFPQPYRVVRDMVRQYCGLSVSDTPEVLKTKLERRLGDFGLDIETSTDYLLHLFDAETCQYGDAASATLCAWTLSSLRQFFLHGSRQMSLIMMIDNVPYTDPASAAFFTMLSEHLANVPLLLITTTWPTALSLWTARAPVTRISLPALRVADSQRLVRAALPSTQVSETLMHHIVEKAQGNPLFLETLSALIVMDGATLETEQLPPTLEAALALRLARLPTPAQRLLQMASVFGPTFTARQLQNLWEHPEEVPALLQTVTRLAFCAIQAVEPEPSYAFQHSLMQQAAYTSLPEAQRHILHTSAGQTLETLYSVEIEDIIPDLAYHYCYTTQPHKAIYYLQRLAEQALQHQAYTEATTALQAALQCAVRLPTIEAQEQCYLELQYRLVQVLLVSGQVTEAQALVDAQQSRLAQVQDTILHSRYALLLGQIYSQRCAWPHVVLQADRAIQGATQAQDRTILGPAYHLLAMARYGLGQPRAGIEASRQAVALLAQTTGSHQLGMAYVIMACHAVILGEFVEALRAIAEVEALGKGRRGRLDLQLLAIAAWAEGWIVTTYGEWERGVEACQRGLTYARDPLNATFAQGWLGYALLEQGAAASAARELRQAAHNMAQLDYPRLQGWYTTFLGEAQLLQGHISDARKTLQQALVIAETAHDQLGMGWAERALGRLEQACHDLPQALLHVQAALQRFHDMSAPFEVGRTHLLLADLAQQQHQAQEALQHVTIAHERFTALHVPRYVARTEQWTRTHGLRAVSGT